MDVSVVDIARFDRGSARDKTEIADAFAGACRDTGFLVVSGHGVRRNLQDELVGAARDFFDQPLAEKLQIRRQHDERNRGYIPFGEEQLARMHGGDTPPDFKEVFAIGPPDVPAENYYECDEAYPNFAPNVWPEHPPALRIAMQAYYGAMERLSRQLMQIAATALELREDWFEDKLDRHTSHLRLLHYPAPEHDLVPGQLRCGEHTDLGAITILRNEAAAGGLEVRARNGEWLVAPALEDTFIVNIGDLMARWTNDQWVSTPHRVAVPEAELRSGSRRLSIAYFLRPNYDAPITCIPSCCSAGAPALYPPTTLGDYAVARFSAGAGTENAG
ncbi:MAG: isopenicillin N synthase family oxygenase [Chromatiales bacterium]|jgi:isopenicillin N synthase-like dioxygenase|nr:isopenicillin N synthase family oxygenase [Chromatiales bacterium]